MGTGRFFSIAATAALVLSLGAVTAPSAGAAQRGDDLCVAISGGVVENATVLDVVADGGTAIGDAGGGTGNLALTADGGDDNDRDRGNNNNNRNNNNNNNNRNNNNNNNNNRNNDRNDWSAESLQTLELRLQQTDTASAGNAGVATASADGGAVSIQDINSGGNAGNAISVGDTVCAGAAPEKPAGGGGGYVAPSSGGGGGGSRGGRGGERVRALPSTGVGELAAGANGSLFFALGALGLMGLSLGSRLDRRVSATADR